MLAINAFKAKGSVNLQHININISPLIYMLFPLFKFFAFILNG